MEAPEELEGGTKMTGTKGLKSTGLKMTGLKSFRNTTMVGTMQKNTKRVTEQNSDNKL